MGTEKRAMRRMDSSRHRRTATTMAARSTRKRSGETTSAWRPKKRPTSTGSNCISCPRLPN